MSKKFKITLLWIAQKLGLFALSAYLFRHHLRVLCYHGFSFADEHLFRPKLFMTAETFRARLEYLANSRYNIVSLQDGLAHPERTYQLALTMDDGWSGTIELVGDILAHYRMPLMLYVTSYYADKQIPVLNVAVSYLLWKTKQNSLDFSVSGAADSLHVELPPSNHGALVQQICRLLDQMPDVIQRENALYELADKLKISLKCKDKTLFRLLDATELAQLQLHNVELQLHTHRHCSPLNQNDFAKELDDNKQWLSQFTPVEALVHFCYPSGEYQNEHLALLKQNQIQTATTTQIGLHQHGSDLLQIRRILDGEDVHLLEFEAELSGFASMIRRVLGVTN